METTDKTLHSEASRDSDRDTYAHHVALRNRLEIIKDLATIASAVAIPVVLATVGYFVQQSVALQGVQKDYVGFAVSILKDDPKRQDPDLRKWAIAVMAKNSPVPFTEKMKFNWEMNPDWFLKVPSSPASSAGSANAEITCLIEGLSAKIEAEKKALPPAEVNMIENDATAKCNAKLLSTKTSK